MSAPLPWRRPEVQHARVQRPVVKIGAAYGRLYVSGPNYLVVRGLPGAALNEKRQWIELSLTLETLRAIRKALGVEREYMARLCTPQVLAWARAAHKAEQAVTAIHRKLETGWRDTFPWADVDEGRPPFAHQEVMASVAMALDGAAFLCEMGTAKTRPALEAIQRKLQEGAVGNVLVACPKGVMATWQRQARRWTPELARRLCLLVDMPIKERERILRATGRDGRVFVVNFDVLDPLTDAIVELSQRVPLGYLNDEMHVLRNPQAKMTQAAMKVAQHAEWRLGLTGSPILNGIEDVWSQWYMVDLGVTFGANFVQFRREFFREGYDGYSLDPLDGTVDEIGLRLRRRGLRYRKDECLDLPPKLYEQEDIELTTEQQRAYKEMQDFLVARLRGTGPVPTEIEESELEVDADDDGRVATAANQLVMILRLTQITSGFVGTDAKTIHRFTPNPKLDAVERLVREHIGQHQIVVWGAYREDFRAIAERLAEFQPVKLIGGMKVEERQESERKFQTGETRLLIGNPHSGGLGIDLYAGSLVIYYSQGYSLDARLQSEDRCHRAGSERHNHVTYVDLIARGTVDEIVQAALRDKKSVADAVVDLRRHLGLEPEEAAA